MKKLILPMLCGALLFGSASCSDNKPAGDATATADNNAEDNAMRSGVNGDAQAAGGLATQPGDNTTTATGAAPATPDELGAGAAAGTPTNALSDTDFINKAAMSDQNEIQLSKLVLSKGVTGMTKTHANQMITDHTKSTADLKKVASKKGVTPPADMDAEHKAIRDQLSKLSGQQLEAQYMQTMLTDHQKTVALMQAQRVATKDADLLGFIDKTTPVVQGHLRMFKQHAAGGNTGAAANAGSTGANPNPSGTM